MSLVAFGLIAFFALGILGYRWNLKRQINQEIEELKKAGYPTTPEELDNWYPRVPDKENAALVYIQAYQKYVEYVHPDPDYNPFDYPRNSPELKKAQEEFLKKVALAEKQFVEACHGK